LQLHLYFLVSIKIKQNHGMGQFGDALSAIDVSAINQLIRHDACDGSAFYVLFQKVMGLTLGFMFRAFV